jgi:UDP-N-acetyl-D-mannosaminuronate dehydrogenase
MVVTSTGGKRDQEAVREAGTGRLTSILADRGGNLVILESTSPVGTTERIAAVMAERGEIADIQLAHCPERVLPGRILEEVVNNPRVIGASLVL